MFVSIILSSKMGLLPCPLPCQRENAYKSNSNRYLHSDSSSSFSTSLSSQPSLPSVPSLTAQPHHHDFSNTATHRCISTFKGHSSPVFSLALAGELLFSGSSNKEIRLWKSDSVTHNKTNNDNNIVAIGNGAVKSIIVSGDTLFSAHQDNKIRVWKINNENPFSHYKCIAILPTLTDRVQKLFSAKNYVQVRRHKKCTWVHHVDVVSALALSKDGSVLYSASWDRTLKIWRTTDFKCLESIWNAHDDAINAIVLSNDGYVYTGSADRKIKVWKKQAEKKKKHVLVATLEKHKSAVNALALSTDGTVLYSGACDRAIVVWEKERGEGNDNIVVAGALRGHTNAILCLAVVSDLISSGSADRTVRIWKREIGRNSYSCLAVLEGHNGPVKCLAASVGSCEERKNYESGTSCLIYSGSLDCDIKVWQTWIPPN